MRATHRPVLVAFGLVVLASAAQAAGTVKVSYVQPEAFADIGIAGHDRESNLQQLSKHFEILATRYLADGQTLSVEVLDVDLAGTMKPVRRGGQDFRVLKGAADWPRVTLRYTLQAAGSPSRSGEAKLADLGYLQNVDSVRSREPLYSERRMLDKWFAAQFGPASDR